MADPLLPGSEQVPASSPAAVPAKTLGEHVRRTFKLGLPLVGVQLASVAIQTTDILMVGRLGAGELAAVSLAGHMIFFCFFAALGFTNGAMAIAAEGEGSGDVQMVRRSTRMGFWIVTVVAMIFMPLFWQTEWLLLTLGQAPEVAVLGQDYMRIAMFSLFPILWLLVARSYLSAVDHTQILAWVTIIGIFANALLNYAFIFGELGAPELGVRGAAIATVGSNIFMLVGTVGYAVWHRSLSKYAIFQNPLRMDFQMMRRVFRVGLPISFTVLAEGGLFIAASFLIGQFGVLALASHTIALQAATVAFMIPFGLSGAVTVRVGQAYGRNDAKSVGLAGQAGILMAFFCSATAALCFLVFAPQIAGLFVGQEVDNAAAVIAGAIPLIMVAGAFQLVDGLQVTSAAILRGLQDTRTPMVIAIFGYWGVGMTMGVVCAFIFDLGPVGIWIGLASGLAVAGLLLSLRFLRREQLGLLAERHSA
jgi:MATE family multidrug resistance protein